MMYLWGSYKKKIGFFLHPLSHWRKESDPEWDPDLDPLTRGTDRGIRIRIKMSRIPNTDSNFKLFNKVKILKLFLYIFVFVQVATALLFWQLSFGNFHRLVHLDREVTRWLYCYYVHKIIVNLTSTTYMYNCICYWQSNGFIPFR
jgi:hypothetical protein